jgi:hypothetical protein
VDLRGNASSVEYQTTALALYSITFRPDHAQIAGVTQARRIQTPFRSPQLDLWQLSDTECLLALRQPESAQRRNRGKLVALARQLPLPDVSGTGEPAAGCRIDALRHQLGFWALGMRRGESQFPCPQKRMGEIRGNSPRLVVPKQNG